MTEKKAAEAAAPIVAYKGFDKDMKCRGFQFDVGKTYRHDGPVRACESGFHACTEPFDVWGYYGPVDCRFAEVELSGKTATHDQDSKIAAAKITIKAELTLPQFIKRAVDRVIELTKGKGDDPSGNGAQIGSSGDDARIGSSGNGAQIGASSRGAQIGSSGDYARIGSSGDDARIGSSGDYARIGSSGDDARIGSSGDDARIGSSGDYAQIGSSGDDARIGSSGYGARIGSSGDDAQIGSSGDDARIGSSGDYAQIGSSGYGARIGSSGDDARIGANGDYARIEATGANAVVASAGYETRVKGAIGTWVSLAEYRDGECVGFATGCIGQDGLEPDVWYVADGGKLVKENS
jgi:hypothetical protein